MRNLLGWQDFFNGLPYIHRLVHIWIQLCPRWFLCLFASCCHHLLLTRFLSLSKNNHLISERLSHAIMSEAACISKKALTCRRINPHPNIAESSDCVIGLRGESDCHQHVEPMSEYSAKRNETAFAIAAGVTRRRSINQPTNESTISLFENGLEPDENPRWCFF